jgi:hypothetical protein
MYNIDIMCFCTDRREVLRNRWPAVCAAAKDLANGVVLASSQVYCFACFKKKTKSSQLMGNIKMRVPIHIEKMLMLMQTLQCLIQQHRKYFVCVSE